MRSEDPSSPKVLQIYLEISQYPILSHTIRERMREELFSRGILSRENFETEVFRKALESQRREGLTDPLYEEPELDWDKRVRYIRAHLTDFYFAYNLPYDLFEQILADTLQQREPDREVRLTFNPEIAPGEMLLSQGERFERLPEEDQARVRQLLREIVVVLIKAMISDHLGFVGLAKEVFKVSDLKTIHERILGHGKIGGKAAGMLLAWKLLQEAGAESGIDPAVITIPDSYYIGSNVFYEVHELNDLFRFMNQKYKTREEIIAEYPLVQENYRRAQLPEYVADQLRELLDRLGPVPLVFRSSSLLEDSFSPACARKYESPFVSNQSIFASTLNPNALIYRQEVGLVDFDERMAVLIQKIEGQHHGRYYFPMIAGVGLSRNPFRWSSRIRREDGLLRLVCGLGTRAVDRVGYDYPRMMALSHPELRPEADARQQRKYSQHLIDVLDTQEGTLKTLPITEVIDGSFPALRLIAVQDTGETLRPFVSQPQDVDPSEFVFTFDPLAQCKTFTSTMRNLLNFLERRYRHPIDIEFAVEATQTWPRPEFRVTLLQCRPLSEHLSEVDRRVPKNIPDADKLFFTNRQVPEGILERIRYIVYVKPEAYRRIPDTVMRLEVARAVGRINEAFKERNYILMGPGRWGTSNPLLGVRVTSADIYNCRALIEIAYSDGTSSPEMAYGTHFFQDLVESKIFPLALFPYEDSGFFNWAFFNNAPNLLADLFPFDAEWEDVISVIDVPEVANGRMVEIIMDADHDEALGYLKRYD